MIWYFLPDPGIFGGVKVACQFVDLLGSCGRRAVAVLPGAQAPRWFSCRTSIVSEEDAHKRIRAEDYLMITWPPDYVRLKDRPGRLVCHCQGTDSTMEPILGDSSVPILTCWEQARLYLEQKFGRSGTNVGISISECFYFRGGRKFDNLVAYMPRRGFAVARRCMRRNQNLDFRGIDGLDEFEVARRLQASGVFLATAEGEQFGLPALEAMAAGCLVLSVPVKGGMEYLNDGENCLVAERDEMPDKLRWIMSPERAEARARLRSRAVATATQYRPSLLRRRLRRCLQGELSWLI
jgi:glycosyltransferase involved in cell wall biosynthesis